MAPRQRARPRSSTSRRRRTEQVTALREQDRHLVPVDLPGELEADHLGPPQGPQAGTKNRGPASRRMSVVRKVSTHRAVALRGARVGAGGRPPVLETTWAKLPCTS